MHEAIWEHVHARSYVGRLFTSVKKVKSSREFWQITKFAKQTVVHARLPDLTNVAAEVYGISFLQNWQTESRKGFLSIGVANKNSIPRTRTFVLRLLYCVWDTTTPLQIMHGDEAL